MEREREGSGEGAAVANEAIKALPKYIFIYIFGKLLLIMAATIKARQVAHTHSHTHTR